jgi:hypothetical protein
VVTSVRASRIALSLGEVVFLAEYVVRGIFLVVGGSFFNEHTRARAALHFQT